MAGRQAAEEGARQADWVPACLPACLACSAQSVLRTALPPPSTAFTSTLLAAPTHPPTRTPTWVQRVGTEGGYAGRQRVIRLAVQDAGERHHFIATWHLLCQLVGAEHHQVLRYRRAGRAVQYNGAESAQHSIAAIARRQNALQVSNHSKLHAGKTRVQQLLLLLPGRRLPCVLG